MEANMYWAMSPIAKGIFYDVVDGVLVPKESLIDLKRIVMTAPYWYKFMLGDKWKEVDIFADSGGFQFIKDVSKMLWMRHDLMSWQVNVGSCQFIMDIPSELRGNEWFKNALRYTFNNVGYFFQNFSNHNNFNPIAVLHGSTLEELDLWWNMLSNWQFDRWAVGLKLANWRSFLFGVMYICEKYRGCLEMLHCLGLGDIFVIGMVLVVLRELGYEDKIKKLTFDTSTPMFLVGKGVILGDNASRNFKYSEIRRAGKVEIGDRIVYAKDVPTSKVSLEFRKWHNFRNLSIYNTWYQSVVDMFYDDYEKLRDKYVYKGVSVRDNSSKAVLEVSIEKILRVCKEEGIKGVAKRFPDVFDMRSERKREIKSNDLFRLGESNV